MDFLCCLKTWTPSARRARKQEQQDRIAIVCRLQEAFGDIARACDLKKASDIRLRPGVIESYSITVEDLNLYDTGYAQGYAPCFFQPLPPLDLQHKVTKDDIVLPANYDDYDEHHYRGGLSSAHTINTELHRLFRSCHRIAPNNQRCTLRQLTGWVPGPLVRFSDDFERSTSWSLNWTLGDTWIRTDYGASPHCMISLEHWCAPTEDLLEGEILAIMAAIIVRLRDPPPGTKDHLVIPVMVFSCMGGWKARILQAHSYQGGIVIRKTALYDFSTWENAVRSFDLFLRFMGSAPIGDTRHFPAAPTPPVQTCDERAAEHKAVDVETHSQSSDSGSNAERPAGSPTREHV